jgi:hypothetical protein
MNYIDSDYAYFLGMIIARGMISEKEKFQFMTSMPQICRLSLKTIFYTTICPQIG